MMIRWLYTPLFKLSAPAKKPNYHCDKSKTWLELGRNQSNWLLKSDKKASDSEGVSVAGLVCGNLF
jgi:hypothetical protein